MIDLPPTRATSYRPLRDRSSATIAAASVIVAAAALLAGCATMEPEASAGAASATPHGFVAGAAEAAEPQLRLATVGHDGALALRDLLSGDDVDVEGAAEVDLAGATAVSTDGRYAFVAAEAAAGSAAGAGAESDSGGARVTIVDTGAWTVDHEDHFHYYLADARVVGEVVAEAATTGVAVTGAEAPGAAGITSSTPVVHSGPAITAVWFPATGERVLLDSAALGEGRVDELARTTVEPHVGALVPLGDALLASVATTGDSADSIEVLDSEGAPVGLAADCPALAGTITTRVGVVFGCSDGALLATTAAAAGADDGAAAASSIAFERIPYPAEVTSGAPDTIRAVAFDNRAGRPTVAAVAGEAGVWTLDTRERTWALLPTETPLLRASAVDDRRQHIVALAADGRVLVLDGGTGATVGATDVLLPRTITDARALAGVTLTVDADRAYLNAPLEGLVHEIDFRDGARISRTFEAVGGAALLVETGR